jgi:hypothetical protein
VLIMQGQETEWTFINGDEPNVKSVQGYGGDGGGLNGSRRSGE